MEEAFANAVEIWQRLSYPEMPSDRQIRDGWRQNTTSATADARRNDLYKTTGLSEEQINNQVATEIFNIIMTSPNNYTLNYIIGNMKNAYCNINTFLVPEYAAYTARSEALLRHQWNCLASMMPFELPRNQNFDYYRARFKSDAADWARYASTNGNAEESI